MSTSISPTMSFIRLGFAARKKAIKFQARQLRLANDLIFGEIDADEVIHAFLYKKGTAPKTQQLDANNDNLVAEFFLKLNSCDASLCFVFISGPSDKMKGVHTFGYLEGLRHLDDLMDHASKV